MTPWCGCAVALELYVSANGSDRWTGRLREPNAAKTDGPFATLERAKAAARELRAATLGLTQPITVRIRGGRYGLTAPIVFRPQDSGTAQSPLVFDAYPGEHPVISGGARMTGWRVNDKGWWQVRLPDVASGKWHFSQLFVNDERRYRSRVAKGRYAYIQAALPPSGRSSGKNPDRFRFRPGDVRADWANMDDIDVLCFNNWSMCRMKIESVNDQKRIITFRRPTWSWQFARLAANERYTVENVREALAESGEWYLDRPTGILTYIPLPGETIETAEVVAPRAPRLVEMQGEPELGLCVEYVELRGLTFEHTNWNAPREGYAFYQGEAVLGGAIMARGARRCVLRDCRVRHTGDYAVAWDAGCGGNRVESCELTDLGGGGVKIGAFGFNDQSNPRNWTRECVVRDTLIAHGGRLHPAAVGVIIGHAHNNVVEHNEIFDFYYSGMSLGWRWSPGFSPAHHNTVAFNHIHLIGQGVLSDMAGIYTLGESPGTVLRGNVIHDVRRDKYGGWGIYFDASTANIVAEGNVVYDTQDAGFHLHYGRNNTVRSNIFAFGEDGQMRLSNMAKSGALTLERNIFYWQAGDLFERKRGPDDEVTFSQNLYWRVDEPDAIQFAKNISLDEWRKREPGATVADPLFTNPGDRDFRLRAGSPARVLGFESIDASRAGRRNTPAATRKPAAPRAFPPLPASPPPPPPPEPIDDGFEEARVGAMPWGAEGYEEKEHTEAVIRVTDECAAAGKHSLKFTDRPGQQFRYNPHLAYRPQFKTGVMVGSFDLRLEPGAVFYHEWRDWPRGKTLRAGPSLRVEADGALVVGRQVIARLPHGKWAHIEIVCGTGEQLTGKWELKVRLPGAGEALHVPDLPCHPELKTVDWVGFVADSDQASVLYVDNVRFGPEGAR